MGILANFSNPKQLNTLFLDGCERIDDLAILALVSGKHKDQSGSSGLVHLSLSECKNIKCGSLKNIKSLKKLRRLDLLGCVNVGNEGILALVSTSETLEYLNIGGTGVTSQGIFDLVRLCNLPLKEVVITGCKKLKNSDEDLLQRHGLKVTGGEDLFRFYLQPDVFSELNKITNSVLKTRSTLSIH